MLFLGWRHRYKKYTLDNRYIISSSQMTAYYGGCFYKKRQMFILREHPGSLLVSFGGVCVARRFSFFYFVLSQSMMSSSRLPQTVDSVSIQRTSSTFGTRKDASRQEGFSEKATSHISKAVRESTCIVSVAKWTIFTDSRSGQYIDQFEVSAEQSTVSSSSPWGLIFVPFSHQTLQICYI